MFLYPDQSPIQFQDELPEAVDVVIIGGGVIGVSTAWHLVKRGHSVLICDKGRVAGEQSSRNWGWVRVNGRDEAEIPVAIESLRCWQELTDELGDEIGFVRRGIVELAETEEDCAFFDDWIKLAKQHDLDTKLLSPAGIKDLIPAANGQWRGAMITPSDGRAEPFRAVPAIARGVRARGGHIRENCAVRAIDIQAGRATGVITEHGAVRANAVVCATGAWSNMFLANMGVSLPQLAVRATVARTETAPNVFDGAAGLKDIYVRRRADGGYTVASAITEHLLGANSFRYFFSFLPSVKNAGDIRLAFGRDVTQAAVPRKCWSADEVSPFESNRVLNPAPSSAMLGIMRSNLDKRLPELSKSKFAETWAGMIDAMPDVVPVMDALPSCDGLFLATGFSGHGFGIGPGAGKVVADLVEGRTPQHNLSRFRLSRFSDGSKLNPGPGL